MECLTLTGSELIRFVFSIGITVGFLIWIILDGIKKIRQAKK